MEALVLCKLIVNQNYIIGGDGIQNKQIITQNHIRSNISKIIIDSSVCDFISLYLQHIFECLLYLE